MREALSREVSLIVETEADFQGLGSEQVVKKWGTEV